MSITLTARQIADLAEFAGLNVTQPNEDEADYEFGCRTPAFTAPIEALRFLSARFKYAGVGEAVAKSYARDIDAILAEQPEGKGALARGVAQWVIAALGDLTSDYAAMTSEDVEQALLANVEHAPVGVDEARRMTPYMAKLWLNEQLSDHEVTLPSELHDDIVAALAGKDGA